MTKEELFCERARDYRATVKLAANDNEIAALVARFLQESRALSCVVPPGLDTQWYAPAELAGVRILCDDPPLSYEVLDGTAAVLTAAAVGIAATGTLALDHRLDQGRRVISLLPDTHICVVRAAQIVEDVPEALALLESSVLAKQPVTWISGPSATVDIELIRVEGVHGPRNLFVIVAR
ncbi:MAG: LUD domain-containing protein [Coriobacteriales bacterium]|jgi:L-lactate dehydrogenase complex protein LldG|nr:LUD domain-containing protein [Coriobacteriales bacterium]